MENSIDISDYGMYVLEITRNEIEEFDHIRTLEILDGFKNNSRNYEGKLNLVVTGYDDDTRELFEIDDVRNYFIFLDKCFPYWFYFLIKLLPAQYSPLSLLASLIVPLNKISNENRDTKVVEFEEKAYRKFFEVHFQYLNELTEELGLEESENKRISIEALENLNIRLD